MPKATTKTQKPFTEQEVILILDRSGSMGSVRNDVIDGVNTYIKEVAKAAKKTKLDTKMTLCQFDDRYQIDYEGKPVSDAPKLTEETYVPRGMTALLDSIAKTIHATDERIKKEKKTKDKDANTAVLVAVYTDGHENNSTEFRDPAKIKELVKDKEKKGWTFVFLGADMDAWDASKGLGYAASSTLSVNSMNTVDNFTRLAGSTAIYMARGASGQSVGNFFDPDADATDTTTPTSTGTTT